MRDDSKDKEMVFYPNFLFREAVAALIIVALVVAIALVFPMKVGDPADPSDSAFKPRPEWYFMSAFYLLKVVPASMEIVSTAILPLGLAVLLVVFPFFDKDPEQRPSKRPVAMTILALSVAAISLLTIMGILS
jgi:quinol-cytochrome oxidoreductase complex cytochrome b subunit